MSHATPALCRYIAHILHSIWLRCSTVQYCTVSSLYGRESFFSTYCMCALLNTLSIPCSLHRMSEEKETIRSSGTPGAAPPPASSSPSATVANLRTVQDVEREIREEMMKLNRLMKQWEDAVSAHKAARTAEELAKAKESVDTYRFLMDISGKLFESLFAERAQLQVAANASSEQKSEFLFYVHSTLCLCIVRVQLTVYVSGCYSTLQRPLCCILDNPSYCWHIKTVIFASLTTYTTVHTNFPASVYCRWLAWTYTPKRGYYRSHSFHAVPVCS